MWRTSRVINILIDGVSEASTFICGDSGRIKSRSRALALQREVSIFYEDEGDFADYPVFSREIPSFDPCENEVSMEIHNPCHFIKVNCVKVLAVSAASTFQVGSNLELDLVCKRKHIRNFVTDIPADLKKKKQTKVIQNKERSPYE
ncbi:spore germination protein GerPE [Paenibacillus sp. N1-5-1-14]|uniref:spore germination protein GerPE n=1 Tax=Paenibacillus radicibacter TaxID=2972488 RepID=UPI0021593F28|nr:spore germination protein GerPE [Paenibacillus radicibacter]MCR8641199.1 spore germination protein GerPE [Paenibacillus radicibacter]